MFRGLKLEESISRRVDNGTGTKTLGNGIKKFAYEPKSFFIPQRPYRDSTFLIWCMYSMFMDPLFLYTPVIKDDKKCFKLDNFHLGSLAIVERSFMDFNFLINSVLEMMDEFKQNFRVSPLLVFLFDLSIVLPLPQVLVILAANKRMRGRKFFYAMHFFLIQHMLKIIRFYTLVTKAKTSNKLTRWAKFTFNLSFFQAAHITGAVYYFLALDRKTKCWRKVCTNDTRCDQLPFYCDDKLRNYTFSNDFCSPSTQNITTYDFGIFKDAIQFGVVEESNFFKRFVASFRWSLQNLSSFGQGLPSSTNFWDNIFVMCITITGVVLFFFLIAKVQSEMSKSEEIRQKVKEIDRWVPFGKLPHKLQNEVKEHQSSSKWRETRGVDVESLLNNLPEDLRNNIKRKLCLDLLKRVEEFRNWSDASLEDLCDVVKPVVFTERSYIVREGDTIDQMLFVVQGKLWSYTTFRSMSNHLEDGDCGGEQLVAWAKTDRDSSNLPVSTRTIQALTNVEAFVLMAYDLKIKVLLIIKQNNAARLIQLVWRARTRRIAPPPSPSSRIYFGHSNRVPQLSRSSCF